MCPRTFLTTLVCSENKGADQLGGHRALVYTYAKSSFSHDAAHISDSLQVLLCSGSWIQNSNQTAAR